MRRLILCAIAFFIIIFIDAKLTNSGEMSNLPRKTVYLVETSWYGKEFHGKKTAGGKRFNMYDYTAAHRTLDFGIQLLLTNPENLLSTIVIINDRGPWNPRFLRGKNKKLKAHPKRKLDISYQAARDLGITKIGVAQLWAEIIDP